MRGKTSWFRATIGEREVRESLRATSGAVARKARNARLARPRDQAEPQGGLTRFDVIAMALHEEEGRRLVAATHADLADHLDLITRLVVAR